MTFVVSSPMGSPQNSGSGLSVTPGVSGSDFARAAGGYLVNRYGASVAGAVGQRMDKVVSGLNAKISGSDGDNNSSGKSSNSKSSNNGNSGNNDNSGGSGSSGKGGRRASKSRATNLGGSPNSEGVPHFTLDTGISSGTIVNPLQPTTKYYSPLYVQCGELFSITGAQTDTTLANLLNTDLYYKYLMIIQTEVNFSLARQFSEATFYSYIGVISEALQLYYMIDSILAYTSHTPNNNLAMMRLRMAITPEISNSHIKLKELLESTPIPPNLLTFIRYMYQNYSFGDVDGSSVIRLSYKDSLCTSEYKSKLGIDLGTYVSIIDRLVSLSPTSSAIRKIRSSWVAKLLPSSYEALFDPQFSTFWHNSNIAYEDYGSKTVKYTINAKNSYDTLYYGIFDNRLDGMIYASCSVAEEDGSIEKGMWKPFNEFANKNSINSSLLHFSNDYFIRPVTEVELRHASMVHSAPHTEVTDAKNPIWKVVSNHYAAACIPQLHTLDNVTQAVTRSVAWLLNP